MDTPTGADMHAVHLDLTVIDSPVARRFFAQVLGWRLEAFDAVPGYDRSMPSTTAIPPFLASQGSTVSRAALRWRPWRRAVR